MYLQYVAIFYCANFFFVLNLVFFFSRSYCVETFISSCLISKSQGAVNFRFLIQESIQNGIRQQAHVCVSHVLFLSHGNFKMSYKEFDFKGPLTDLFEPIAKENLFSYNLIIFSWFKVISCVLTFS